MGCMVCKLCLGMLHKRPSQELPRTASKILANLQTYGFCRVRSHKTLHLTHLKRHQTSEAHQFALAYLSKRTPVDVMVETYAPSESEFRDVWQSAKSGASSQYVPHVGKCRKISRMRWCLAEGCRIIWREFLRRASTVALHEDKRQDRLAIRFTASDDKLHRTCGVLGLRTTHGGAPELVEATLNVLSTFATPGHGRPASELERNRTHDVTEAELDVELHAHVLKATEFFNADCEGAEQLAGKMMSGKAALQRTARTLPNIRIVNWDLAHGFKRITARPWRADPYLRETFSMFITNRDSIVRLIQNSGEFRNWFLRNKTKLERRVGKRVGNLSFRGHRMDSTSRPLGRAVMNCFAVVKTADMIARQRRGTVEGTAALNFLRWLDSERVVMLAMMADSGDDALTLTRFVDREATKTEDIFWQVQLFLDKITMLYVDGEVTQTATYTQWVLTLLRDPILFFVSGMPKMLGHTSGVPAPVIRRCLRRMACWVKMAKHVADTEFPSFRVVTSFSIFSLTDGNERGQGSETEKIHEHLARLSTFFGVDLQQLTEQLDDMWPLARQLKSGGVGVTNWEAWRLAIDKVRKRASIMEAHPTHALLPPLIRWCGWSVATSGVEQNFSQMERVYQSRGMMMDDARLLDLFTLVVATLDAEQEARVYRDARRLWTTHYGRARNYEALQVSRIDIGKRKPQQQVQDGAKIMTEKDFISKRRSAVSDKLRSWSSAGAAERVDKRAASQWTDSMQCEVDFQEAKRRKRLVEAHLEGQTVQSDLPGDFSTLEKEYEKKERLNEKRRLAAQKHRQNVLSRLTSRNRPLPIRMRHMKVFFAPSLPASTLQQLRARASVLRMFECKDRNVATLFIVEDLNHIGQRVHWNLALRGGYVATPEYLTSVGARGLIVAYNAAVANHRTVWVSSAFADTHPTLCKILETAVALHQSSWTWFAGSADEFAQRVGRTRACREILGLVTMAEKQSEVRE